jgi:hypothetical protein
MEGEEGKLKRAAAYMAALAGTAGSASAQDKPPCGTRCTSSFNVRGFDSRSLLLRRIRPYRRPSFPHAFSGNPGVFGPPD